MEANYQACLKEIATSKSASFWLKDAATALNKRDPIDALRDAEELFRVAQLRVVRLQDVGLYTTIPGVSA